MATKLIQQGGPPGSPPPVGTVVVYPKSDELLYFQGSDGVEHALAGQTLPLCSVDGTGPTFDLQNGGFTSVVRVGGEPAGVYDVTLAAGRTLSGTLPSPAHGVIPYILTMSGVTNPVQADVKIVGFVGTLPYTYTVVRVTLKDASNTKVDGFFTLGFHSF